MNPEHLQDAARRQAEVQVDLQSLWRRVHRGRHDLRRRRTITKVVITAMLAATLGGLGSWRLALAPEAPTTSSPEAWAKLGAAAAAGEPLLLPDGSTVQAEPGAELALLSLTPDRLHLTLGSGVVDFHVVPGGPRAWVIDAGWVEVQVIGTRFTVARSPDAVEVRVREGRVRVKGAQVPDGQRELGPDESLRIPAISAAPVSAAPAQSPAPVPVVAPTEVSPAPERSPARAKATPIPAEGHPIPEVVHETKAPTPSLDDWLAEAEAARGRGDNRIAAERWALALTHFPEAPSMSLIAFRLGRLRLEALGQPDLAAQAIEQALSLGLPRALEEDAYARLVEAYAKAQDPARARDAKARYRAAFPDARRRAEVEKWSP
jgi:transmembrane sensor